MSTSKTLLWVNKMDMSWFDGGGGYSFFGALVSCGYQVLSHIGVFPRSAIVSAFVLNLAGPFAPPNVSLSDMRWYNVPLQLI